ncbi:MAG: intracellular protease, PfpI family [Ferruginibacter sp.]|uniref:type 1 glutamine amidotransferase domain-containing protein n=1 Tax=Ferruginibacter sp. TaxID=1940288 RepID=UPI002658F221|nr:type 1 glutamine amidotransferase domain-containing protein [Ferruginibacter sp.]MDB5275964.1 intracellular protease, PfpI family [Ferruginibacter sp.]
MTTPNLSGKKVAIITEHGFEEVELTSPKKALEEAGATVHIISTHDSVKAWDTDHWSIELPVDAQIDQVSSDDYDALLIPGGVLNPDKMRTQRPFISFAEEFLEAGKPVAAICHGPQLLIETGLIKGKEMTSYPSLKTDLTNAGVYWVDKEVVTDNGLITSRSPEDLPAFNKKIIEEFAEGVHKTRNAFSSTDVAN